MTRSLAILVLLACLWPEGPARAEPAVVTLHATAAVGGEIVLLPDVATIRGGESDVRERLGAIDLWEFKETDGPEATVTRGLVRTRLLLAGFTAEEFQVAGEEETVVRHGVNIQAAAVQGPTLMSARSGSRTSPAARASSTTLLTDADLELLLRDGIAESLRIDPQDVRVRLGQACLPRVLTKEFLGKEGTMEPTLPTRPLPGRVTVGVRVLVEQKVVANLQTQIDLAIRRPVLVASADLARGTKLSDADIEEQSVWLTRAEPHPRRSDATGASLSRDVFQGQPLKMNDLVRRASGGNNDESLVIKSRDKVQVVARKGPLTIVVRDAEAQQQGRVGEWINVRNTSSNKIISARVVGPGEVEVPLF